jgi:hypothetical protein
MKRKVMLRSLGTVLMAFALVSLVVAGDGARLSGTGSKIWIGKDYYFTYDYDKKPALGTVIVRVEVFDKNGKRDTGFAVTGDSGMPEMKGSHDSGEVAFVLNKKGVYLLPINVVMPGEWQVVLIFKKAGKLLFAGHTRFNV